MGIVELKYIGKYQSHRIMEVDEKLAQGMVDTGEYEFVTLDDKIKAEHLEVKPKIKKSDLNELSKIKGIGKERINDLKKIYSNKDELIMALRKNTVPLRNDVVDLLKKNFNIEEEK